MTEVIVNLEDSRLLHNIQVLREQCLNEFLDIIPETVGSGSMALILDPDLTGPLGLVVEPKVLKQCPISTITELHDQPFESKDNKFLFFVYPRLELMAIIAKYIFSQEKVIPNCEYTVVFVPRKTMMCERELEKLGVLGNVTLEEFHMDLIPLDEDVLTMSVKGAFRQIIDQDTSNLIDVAKSILKFEAAFGQFNEIDWIGSNSEIVADILQRTKNFSSKNNDQLFPSQVERLIIFDRKVDLLSPIVTQLTYEGLIDEIYGIENGIVQLDPQVLGHRGNKKERKPLNSNDILYAMIRDMNMGKVGEFFKKTAKQIELGYENRNIVKNLSELKTFVKKLPSLQAEHHSLDTYISIYEDIVKLTGGGSDLKKRIECELGILGDGRQFYDYLKTQIWKEENLNTVLRLLCIQSLSSGGLKNKHFDFFRKEIIHTYGFNHVNTLANLEKLGMFKKKEGNKFDQIRKNLKLFDDNFLQTNDISLVHSGYAPISIRLIQCLFEKKRGWESIDDIIKNQIGTHYGKVDLPKSKEKKINSNINQSNNTKKKLCLVFFIGGVTYAEISALRILGQKENSNVEFIIATTNILNGNKLIQSTFEIKK
ncbi:vacuolar protein sorting-associated protein 33a [Anaeramoeba flamelloides]|uniref:Vacuolar protein sorting-associated protein 33a n=1 Tax=Anaeramoeba flamelloides TaxID=1746091 RepID=A0AAV7ZIV2_9EUKA|nr:vacuolar protein sorting-associated protein 33a [Anaeramoeba flamelloides]KAJ6232440.1 vacuolar protein sorting-associated protein 33a [Anaeramoeba flamelloides]